MQRGLSRFPRAIIPLGKQMKETDGVTYAFVVNCFKKSVLSNKKVNADSSNQFNNLPWRLLCLCCLHGL